MSSIAKRTISLPAEHAAFIDAKVASGAYASGSEVVRAGLRALQERDEAVERWLREDVAPTYDAMKADPSRALSSGKLLRTLSRIGQSSKKNDRQGNGSRARLPKHRG